ncbi:MAG: flavodoxin family protein [Lachnospiraceae bacterium]|nr:flavodoxin family protein [Lachnospiraceae bacterium]
MKGRLLAISGSPHKNGATGEMLDYAMRIAEQHGYVVDYINLYEKNIAYCKGCRACIQLHNCVVKDDIQEIATLLKECNIIILAAPVYWANVPAIVKNMFDRLLGVMMEETRTFPKPRLSNKQKYILFTACNTPAPFSILFGQSTGAIRGMREVFRTSGMKYGGSCVWTGNNKTIFPKYIERKIEKLFEKQTKKGR